jgi:hypothetical protein
MASFHGGKKASWHSLEIWNLVAIADEGTFFFIGLGVDFANGYSEP